MSAKRGISGVRVARQGGTLSEGTARTVKAATKRAKKSADDIRRKAAERATPA